LDILFIISFTCSSLSTTKWLMISFTWFQMMIRHISACTFLNIFFRRKQALTYVSYIRPPPTSVSHFPSRMSGSAEAPAERQKCFTSKISNERTRNTRKLANIRPANLTRKSYVITYRYHTYFTSPNNFHSRN
jgi:hypothetical protein